MAECWRSQKVLRSLLRRIFDGSLLRVLSWQLILYLSIAIPGDAIFFQDIKNISFVLEDVSNIALGTVKRQIE